MKRLETISFAVAVALFTGAALHPGSRAVAQMTAWCPGGSNLLCGTDVVKQCTQIDQRTGQCSRWHEQTLYYYHPASDGTPGECTSGGICVQ